MANRNKFDWYPFIIGAGILLIIYLGYLFYETMRLGTLFGT